MALYIFNGYKPSKSLFTGVTINNGTFYRFQGSLKQARKWLKYQEPHPGGMIIFGNIRSMYRFYPTRTRRGLAKFLNRALLVLPDENEYPWYWKVRSLRK